MKTSKNILLTSILTLSIVTTIFSQDQNDYKMIEKTVFNYINGDTNKDFETLQKAFHKNATMKYVSSKNGYQEYNALEVFKNDKGRAPEKNRKNRIEYISVAGKAANVKIEINYPDRTVVDFVNLLKINNEWKIVSKIFSVKE